MKDDFYNKIICGDALKLIKDVSDDFVNLILTNYKNF